VRDRKELSKGAFAAMDRAADYWAGHPPAHPRGRGAIPVGPAL